MSDYTSWYVGMKVVCVEPKDDPEPPNPAYGEVYTISWVGVSKQDGEVMIDLVELPNPDSDEFEQGYEARGFRPAITRKTDISILTAILNGHRISEDA